MSTARISVKGRLTAAAVFALAGAAHGQFTENFDTTTAGTLPGGWGTSTAGAGAPWAVATTQANSLPNSVFTDDVATVSQQFLTMPSITAAGPVTIDLWSYYSVESTFDGWVVEASINGGPYANIGQGAWRLNGYNATISSSFSSPIAGQQAFSGAALVWTRRTAVIGAASGDQVSLRIQMASDTSANGSGVWIDDVSVTTSSTAVCCQSNGTCAMLAPAACTAAGGVVNLIPESCAAASCPQPAACCASSGSCSMALPSVCVAGGGAYQGAGSVCGGCGGAFFEAEPNETRPAATPISFFAPGNFIQGNTTGAVATAGAASLDQFLVKTPAMPLGIYRNRLTITTSGTAGHVGSIRGLTQTAAAAGTWPGPVGTPTASDAAAQTSSTATTPARMDQWYGFGKREQVYYRVTGVAGTTADYQATLAVDPVTPADLGVFLPGQITISTVGQGHTTDTALWVYDGNLNAIEGFGNDDASTNGGHTANLTTSSFLRRDYSPGTYYLAMSTFNLALSKGAPCDDNTRTDVMLDFPDAALNSSTTANVNCAFAVTDSAATTAFAATRAAAFDILWYRFSVLPLTAVGACCKIDGTCAFIALGDCQAAGGTFRGENVACSAANCPPPGACCQPAGTCISRTSAACTAAGGVYGGDNVACGSAGCVPAAPVTLPLTYNWNGMVSPGLEQGEANRTDLNGYRAIADRGLLLSGSGNAINAGPINGTDSLVYTVNTADHALDIVHLGDRRTVANAARNWNPPGTGANNGPQPSWLLDNDQTVPQASSLSSINATLSPYSRIGLIYQISDGGGRFDAVLTFTDNSSVTLTLRAADWFSVNNPAHPAPAAGSGLIAQRKLGRYAATENTDLGATTTVNDLDVVEAVTSVQKLIADGFGNHAGKRLASITFQNPVSNTTYPNSTPATASGYAILAASVSYPAAGGACYANCDNSTTNPFLNVADFSCFLQKFAAADTYANCDGSTQQPILNVADFSCFLQKFAAGCSAP